MRLAACGRGALQLVALGCFIGPLAAGPQAQAQATTSWGRVKATYRGEGLVVYGDRTENFSTVPYILTNADPPPALCSCLEPRHQWVNPANTQGGDCFFPNELAVISLAPGHNCVNCIGHPNPPHFWMSLKLPDDDGGPISNEASQSAVVLREQSTDPCANIAPQGKWVEIEPGMTLDCNPPYSHFVVVSFWMGPRCATCIENLCD